MLALADWAIQAITEGGLIVAALITGLFVLLNGNRQRKADRDAEDARAERALRASRVARLREDLTGIAQAVLAMKSAAILLRRGGTTSEYATAMASASEGYEVALAGLILDPDGESFAIAVGELSAELESFRLMIAWQEQLSRNADPRALAQASAVIQQADVVDQKAIEVLGTARSLVTSLTGAVPVLAKLAES